VRILVTGANGFIGKNLLATLRRHENVTVLPFTRESGGAALSAAARDADFVFHLAGVNRPTDAQEFVTGNVELTQQLCRALQATQRRIPVVYSSSIQAEQDNPYGRSKLGAEQALAQYAAASGAPVAIYRLPNVFGKWCRPDYNSAVATFCHNIARGLPIRIDNPAAPVRLVYVDDVIAAFIARLGADFDGVSRLAVEPVYGVSVGELAAIIQSFRDVRESLVIDAVGAGLKRALYATYVSHLPPQSFSYALTKHADPRGEFVEMLKTRDSGQFSYFTALPGVTRGGHYHHSKTEKFLVLSGRARFRFRHILTDETYELHTAGGEPQVVETVPGWAHDITNVGNDVMIVMIWANEIFDRERPDTFAEPV
jgi:UDP-2-acetamido-2,6-beta-L-arabino-hexul-4-ose reductase